MKVVSCLVLSACLAGAFASSILLPVANQAAAANAQQVSAADKSNQFFNQASAASRSQGSAASRSQGSAAGDKNHGFAKQLSEDAAHKAAGAQQASSGATAQRASSHDSAATDFAQSAHKASSDAYNKQASRNEGSTQSDVQDNNWNFQRTYNNNNSKKDKIDYAYDKKFGLNDNNDGAYAYAQQSSSDADDYLYNRDAAYDRNVDKYGASASSDDKQSNSRAFQAKENSAANQAARDNFGRDAANSNQLWANQRAFANKLDNLNQKRRDSAVYQNKANALNQGNRQQDSRYQKLGDADKQVVSHGAGYDAQSSLLLAPYNQFSSGPVSGVGHNNGLAWLQPQGFANAAGAQQFTGAQDQAASGQLFNQGAFGAQDRSLENLNRDMWANDQFQGSDNSQGSAYKDQGFSDKADSAAQNADKAGLDSAAAEAAKKQDQSASTFNEDAMFRDSEKKASSDRDSDNRVFQRYYNNDNKNGNNWERLSYDRDIDDDTSGYDKQFQRQQAYRDTKRANAVDQSESGKKADSASANEAAAQKQLRDSQDAAAGHQNQRASNANNAAESRQSYDDRNWKYDQAQQKADNAYQNLGDWRNGGDYHNNNNFGGSFLGGAGYPVVSHGGHPPYSGGFPTYNGGYNFGGALKPSFGL